MRVLLVEDEIELARSIVSYLKKNEKIDCDTAENMGRAVELTDLYDYDCFLVDIGLPDGSGLDLIRIIKSKNNRAGIIIISARDSIDDRISGLQIGADDYLVKPFHLSELNARLYSLMRRLKFDGSSLFLLNEISLDHQSREVKINNKAIELTKSEYNLLLYLITNKNQVISKSSIAEHLAGEYVDIMDSLDFVYLHIKNLRKKLISAGCTDYIKTVYGVGYKFLVE
ncbi:MAG: response regulator transcription factor [Bacteroidia bacterium]|nr:MAG: response regulator transcription factor [Bacteroidia bacterium]